MKTINAIQTAIALAALISMSGCASVMSGTRKNVSIDSNPSNAHVTIQDKHGREVASLNTPAVASLKRSDGFFVPARYTATIEKPGYQSTQVKIEPTGNPWTLGNVVFGGLIGLLIVDPATGAMWGLTPSEIHQSLTPVKPVKR